MSQTASRGRLLCAFLFVALLVSGCLSSRGGRDRGDDDDDSSDDDNVGATASDRDGDALPNDFELEIGTDPDEADSDGDGFEDGVEYLQYFSPLEGDDFPYANSDYPRGALPSDEAWEELKDAAEDDMGRGWNVGEFTRSWAVEDQHGDPLLLKRFYGEVVVVEVAAEWCVPCRTAALEAEEAWQARHEDGFMFVTLLGDGLDPGSGETQALRWAEWPTGQFDGGAHPYGDPSDYGASGPGDPMTLAIVEDGEQDPGSQETAGIYLELNPYYPNFTVIDRDHIVRGNGLLATAAFELADELLDEDRPEVEWPLPENADELRELLGL